MKEEKPKKKMQKWIEFTRNEKYSAGKKTTVWDVTNKDDKSFLGRVGWYGAWRGYVFIPANQTIFEKVCLRDIADFIENVNKEHRDRRKAEKKINGQTVQHLHSSAKRRDK